MGIALIGESGNEIVVKYESTVSQGMACEGGKVNKEHSWVDSPTWGNQGAACGMQVNTKYRRMARLPASDNGSDTMVDTPTMNGKCSSFSPSFPSFPIIPIIPMNMKSHQMHLSLSSLLHSVHCSTHIQPVNSNYSKYNSISSYTMLTAAHPLLLLSPSELPCLTSTMPSHNSLAKSITSNEVRIDYLAQA